MKNILTEALVNSATNASFIFYKTNSAKLRITCFYGKRKCIVIECIRKIISLNLLCKYLQTVVLYLQEE